MGTMLLSNERIFNHYNVLVKYSAMADRMMIASPFLSPDLPGLLKEMTSIKHIELYTNLDGYGMASSVLPAIKNLYEYGKEKRISVSVKYNDKLHGKAYLLYKGNESKGCVITSGNFTDNGLINNHEYGVFIDNESLQEQLRKEILGLSWIKLPYEDVEGLVEKAKLFSEENKTTNQPVFKAGKYLSNAKGILPGGCRYFLKPLGTVKKPVYVGYTILEDTNLGFSKEQPAISKGDIFICHGVGPAKIVGISKVIGNQTKKKDDNDDRWVYKFETECITPKYSSHWWDYELKSFQLTKEFNELKAMDEHVTSAGTDSIGRINFGAQVIEVTKEYARFIMDKIADLE